MIANKFARCMFAMQKPALMTSQAMRFNSGAGGKYEEPSIEKAFFSKNDAELLKRLAAKMAKRDELKDAKKEHFDAVCDDLD